MKPVSSGFSLIELAVVLTVVGLMFAFTIPAFKGLSNSYQLKGAAEDVAGQLRLAREKAIATGVTQHLRFMAGFQSSDYHVWNGATANPKWSLPNGIVYETSGMQTEFRMTKDGRCLDSGTIILKDPRGNKDSVSVQNSGFVLTR